VIFFVFIFFLSNHFFMFIKALPTQINQMYSACKFLMKAKFQYNVCLSQGETTSWSRTTPLHFGINHAWEYDLLGYFYFHILCQTTPSFFNQMVTPYHH
jgi:hypothetical protein